MNTDAPAYSSNSRCAVVTGATQGIGKAIAEKLLFQGYSIAVCARSSYDLQALKAEWSDRYPGRKILVESADFSEKKAVLEFAQRVNQFFTNIDLLVNNAGIFIPGALVTEAEGQLEETMNVNLYSAYHLTRSLLSKMKEGSHIVNMCSVASLKAYPNGGAYSISKYALLGFSENLREELKPRRIRVTAICPGATWSRSWAGSDLPEERLMDASDVANMVWTAHVLSEKANVETIVMRPIDGDL